MQLTANQDFAGGGNILADGKTVLHFHKIAHADSGNAHVKAVKLIVAAPDMLAALKDALHSGQHACNCAGPCEGTCTFSLITAAIKKAEA